jgi:branched-chain amino acid transport system ATP-binding protein
MEVILEAHNIYKSFGGVKALRDVSLNVERGKIVGIIGPNGSGKTTLINVITGFLKADKGRVIFEGYDVTNLPPYSRAKLGLVRTFQIPRPLTDFTTLENAAIAAMITGMDKAEAYKRAVKILEQVRLSYAANIKAGLLNIIEKKRLELARVLALNPKLVMLDEVLAGARGSELVSLLDTIKGLREQGITFVMVEHLVSAVGSISDWLIVLSEGRKIAEGRPKEVLENPEVIKAYIGEVK